MRLVSLEISNFRGIREMPLDFREMDLIVFIGDNGAGKTSVLDCLAVMLSRFLGRICSSRGTGRFISEHDINNEATEARNAITIGDKERTGRSLSGH